VPVAEPVVIPTLEVVRPVAPILETVKLDSSVPPGLLRNYNALIRYSFDLEDYAWGGESPGGLEKYIKDLMTVLNQKQPFL
jgi:hypothetical protein